MTSINDPRKIYDAQAGEAREWSPRLRPQTSNADEWALWLEAHYDYGIPFKAVQIAEALDSMWRGGFNAGLRQKQAADVKPPMTGDDALRVFKPLPPDEAALLREYGEGDAAPFLVCQECRHLIGCVMNRTCRVAGRSR